MLALDKVQKFRHLYVLGQKRYTVERAIYVHRNWAQVTCKHCLSKRGKNEYQRDQFLTEAMGECCHDFYVNTFEGYDPYYSCRKCQLSESTNNTNNDFSTWEGFGKLWEWAQKQDWWGGFLFDSGCMVISGLRRSSVVKLINPDTFADVLHTYLKSNT